MVRIIYANKLKNRFWTQTNAPTVRIPKKCQYYNIAPFWEDRITGLWLGPNPNFSGCLGLIILFMLLFGLAHAENVKVTASVEEGKAYESQPVKVLISITHDISQKVDPSSFTLEGKQVEAEYLQQVEVAPPNPLVISYYRIKLSPQPPGLRLLPEIAVLVGDKFYATIPISFVVEAATPQPAAHVSSEPVLQLKVQVESTPKIYPGQRFNVVYRYMFNQDFELSEERLPLLDPEGFAKVGSKETQSFQRGDMSILEIRQKLEAITPGTFKIPPSKIAGYTYQVDSYGNKTYSKPQFESEQLGFDLTVLPFPEVDMPPSFNGAIGPFDSFKTTLSGFAKVYVGDKIELGLTLEGQGQVDNAPLPELCCQPGFSGVFKIGDLPPAREIKGNQLHAVQELRPLTEVLQKIPSIEFSFFLPQEGKYGVLRSQDIQLNVLPIPLSQEEATEKQETLIEPPRDFEASKAEIDDDMPISSVDLKNTRFGTRAVLYQIPIGIIGFALIKFLHRFQEQRRRYIKKWSSRDFLNEAMKFSPSSSQFYHLTRKAFQLKRLESANHSAEVDAFLQTLEVFRYTGRAEEIGKVHVDKAYQLFQRMDRK